MKLSYTRELFHIAIYILNRGRIQPNSDKTPHELWKGMPTNVKHFKGFGSKCYIKRDDENLGKFESRTDEGIFSGYFSERKAYKCYNLILDKIVDSANVRVDDEKPRRIKIQTSDQSKVRNYDEEKEDNVKRDEEDETP